MTDALPTPAYVFDEKALRARIGFLREHLPSAKLCYAMKANPFLVESLAHCVDLFEVCSPGEYRICERLKIAPAQIVLSGVYKERADIFRIVGQCGDKATYTVESPSQLELLSDAARACGLRLPVCLRLSSGNQFGMDKAAIGRIVEKRNELPLDIEGIQYYSGTQKKFEKIRKEAEMLKAFLSELKENYGFAAKRLEYGPGFGVGYFQSDAPVDETALLRDFCALFEDLPCGLVLEMGRFIAAPCGEYHTKIVDIKYTDGMRYCIVDGGINHLNYYGQTMAMKLPYIRHHKTNGDAAENLWTVCGSLCTTADVLVRSLPLAGAAVGDELVFEKAGAYSVTEGIYLFLSRDMPRVYVRTEDGSLVLRRDAVSTDKINSKE